MTTQGKRFRKIRQRLEKTQQELAEMTGIARTSISKVEGDNGYFDMETYPELVQKLKINLNYLIAGVGNMFLPDTRTDEELKQRFEQISDPSIYATKEEFEELKREFKAYKNK